MKKLLIACIGFLSCEPVLSQVTYIGIIDHNVGMGSGNLFNNYVAVSQQCYIDWEVYADGMTNMEACGSGSVSRLILRRTGNNDVTSVVASGPVIVPGICAGKNGNNDHYYADLGPYIDKPGRYSVEVQADLPGMPDPFGNATTKTTCNYLCPSAYYLTGTSGPTGNYYTPAGNCAGGPGLSDPVGGPSVDMLEEIFPVQKFFTVGEVGAYRHMIVLNGSFYDLPTGKFQPGNPSLPISLNGTNGIPAEGICPVTAAPQISLGGEINTFKRTDCGNADVTGASLFYRLYKDGSTPPLYSSFALNFKDDCSFSPNGPEEHVFPLGGSCQNANGILDQRWQTTAGVNNIMPASFALNDTGLWKINFYTETYTKNCAGNASIQYSDTAATTFIVNNPLVSGSPCASVIPVILSGFSVTPFTDHNNLNWKVEEATQVKNFEVQRSFDGFTFSNIAAVVYENSRSSFEYNDAAFNRTVFYRLVIHELDGSSYYSFIVKINGKSSGIKMTVQAVSQNIITTLENFNKGKYSLDFINTAGSLVAKKTVLVTANGNTDLTIPLKPGLAHGICYAVIRDEKGVMIAKANFYY